jgi:nickel transport protein
MPKKWLWWRRHLPALWVQGVLVILALGVLTNPALAHRVLVYAYAEGDTIHTESKFIPDTPVRQGKILVIDKKTDKVLLTGQTDDQGKFSFQIPTGATTQKMDLKIVAEAAMGHRGEWLLKAASYLPGATAREAAAPTPASPTGPVALSTKATNVDQQALEAVLNKALEHQLAPIKEMLTDLTIHRTRPTDIIGGIGYILGIFGLWAYLQSRGPKKP